MSRTDISAESLAASLRRMAGDGSVEWVMEPIQAAVLLDIADALDENRRLREERDHWHVEQAHAYGNWEDVYKRAIELEKQNAKLRGLVRDVYSLHWSGLDCTECPWIGECETDGGCPWLGILHDHMRDLGIEVPQ